MNPGSWAAKNPLGVIALFISLIYGISALIFGASVSVLSSFNQTVLVLFIVLFPVIVLALFGWLVAFHHKKLYAPLDYRTDESFLGTTLSSPPSALGERLLQETSGEGAETGAGEMEDPDRAEPPEVAGTVNSTVQAPSALPSSKAKRVQEAYIAESLVFQDLQNEQSGAVVKRNVRLRGPGKAIEVDGIVQSGATTTIVEVKLVRGNYAYLFKQIKEVLSRFEEYRSLLGGVNAHDVRLMVALVADYKLDMLSRFDRDVVRLREIMPPDSELRVYNHRDLLAKYSIPLIE